MALQLSVAARNAALDSLETTVGITPILEVRTGAAPANCGTADSGTLLALMTLPSDWLAAAAAGVKGLSGSWQDVSADAAGTTGHFRIKQGVTCHMQGTVTATGGGGDMQFDNAIFAVAQQINVTAFNITGGGA